MTTACTGCIYCNSYKHLPHSTVYPNGYIIRYTDMGMYSLTTVLIPRCEPYVGGSDRDLILTCALNRENQYIGNRVWARELCDELGIYPQLAKPSDSVCSIGFCAETNKWYGWSHRALYGFSIGSEVKKGDCAYTPRTIDDLVEHLRTSWYDTQYKDLTFKHGEVNGDFGVWANYTLVGVNGVPIENSISGQFWKFTPGKGEWCARTLEDAKQMAMDFAESVSSTSSNEFESSSKSVNQYVWFKYTTERKTKLLKHHKTKTFTINQNQVFGLRKAGTEGFYLVSFERPSYEFKLTSVEAARIVRRSRGFSGKWEGKPLVKGTSDILVVKPKVDSSEVKPKAVNPIKKVKRLPAVDDKITITPAIIRNNIGTGFTRLVAVFKRDASDNGNRIIVGTSIKDLREQAKAQAMLNTDVYILEVPDADTTVQAALKGKTRITNIKMNRLVLNGIQKAKFTVLE